MNDETLFSRQRDRSPIDDAWTRIPGGDSRRHVRDELLESSQTFARERVERIIAIPAGIGSALIGTHAAVVAIAQWNTLNTWNLILAPVVFGLLILMIIGCLTGRWTKALAGLFAAAYPAAVLAWPLVATGSGLQPLEAPWIWFLANLATLGSGIAFALPWQIAWAVLIPVVLSFARAAQEGFAASAWPPILLDSSFVLILGAVLLTIGWALRSVALGVDDARAAAVASYVDAAAADEVDAQHEQEVRRAYHAVVAALAAADHAGTPAQQAVATRIAADALASLTAADHQGGGSS